MLSYAQFSPLRYLLDGEHCSPRRSPKRWD